MAFWDETNPAKPRGIKDPNAVLDIPLDWSAWLSGIGDTHQSHTFLTTGGLVVNSSSHSAGVITAWVSGGNVGEVAELTCRITTVGGRTDDRTWFLSIKER